jgi:hypothetical protein
MDRRLARRNIRSGILLAGIAIFFFGFSFLFASLYIA